MTENDEHSEQKASGTCDDSALRHALQKECRLYLERIQNFQRKTERQGDELKVLEVDDPTRTEILDDWYQELHDDRDFSRILNKAIFLVVSKLLPVVDATLGMDFAEFGDAVAAQWFVNDLEKLVSDLLFDKGKIVFRHMKMDPDIVSRCANEAVITIYDYLEELKDEQWVACVPVERRYGDFPKYTDFGAFSILNARAGSSGAHRDVLQDFQRILADDVGVNFHEPRETEDSFLNIAKSIYSKSNHYIPGRPQLVVRLDPGPPGVIGQQVKSRLRKLMPLLRLCQLVCDIHDSGEAHGATQIALMPDGTTPMSHGVVEVSNWALAINRRNGSADTYFKKAPTTSHYPIPGGGYMIGHMTDPPPRLGILDEAYREGNEWYNEYLHPVVPQMYRDPERVFETSAGQPFDPEVFTKNWGFHCRPVIELQALVGDRWGKDPVTWSIDRGIQYLSACLYGQGGNLALNAVVCAESLLNPFDKLSDIKAHFVNLSSGLRASELDDRFEKAEDAQELYDWRCKLTHRAWVFLDGNRHEQRTGEFENDPQELLPRSIMLYLECLGPVVGWARSVLEGDIGEPLSKRRWKRLWKEFCSPFLSEDDKFDSHGSGI